MSKNFVLLTDENEEYINKGRNAMGVSLNPKDVLKWLKQYDAEVRHLRGIIESQEGMKT